MQINLKDVKIGADPELFVRHNGKFISAHGLIKGTKEKPFPVQGGAVQVDGMALEYNIDPCTSESEFVAKNNMVLTQLSQMVPEYELVAQASVSFTKDVWDSAPDEAKVLGCMPDFNGYTGSKLVIDEVIANHGFLRSASGHVHIGWTDGMDIECPGHIEACKILATELDCYLGLPSLLMDRSHESRRRKTLYGRDAAFRPKPYGMEYRVLSNFWVGIDEYTAWVFNNARAAVANLLEGKSLFNSFPTREFLREEKLSEDQLADIYYWANQMKVHLPDSLTVAN